VFFILVLLCKASIAGSFGRVVCEVGAGNELGQEILGLLALPGV
jgi:ABC-type tungstate transport system substrate-binding protein